MKYSNDTLFFVAAPFGNYLKFKKKANVLPVTGTWTLKYRGGILKKIYKIATTLRYKRKKEGWVNKMGLPNVGLNVGLRRINNNEILSIAELEKGDFEKMSFLIPKDQSIEINLSCPNVKGGEKLPWNDVRFFNKENSQLRKYCIAKISPYPTEKELEFLIDDQGFNYIHCCNTLPVEEGGLSGKKLKHYVEDLIKMITSNWGKKVEIIAGGGISNKEDALHYLELGAKHLSLGTVCFTPWKIKKILS